MKKFLKNTKTFVLIVFKHNNEKRECFNNRVSSYIVEYDMSVDRPISVLPSDNARHTLFNLIRGFADLFQFNISFMWFFRNQIRVLYIPLHVRHSILNLSIGEACLYTWCC